MEVEQQREVEHPDPETRNSFWDIMFRFNFLWWLALATTVGVAYASSGDRARDFQDCTSKCVRWAPNCRLPLALRLTRWTCLDDCRYQCMHLITDKAVSNGASVQQYFGKWPFIRLAGMQEPASVLFSLFNLVGHARGAIIVQESVPNGHPMKNLYLGWALVGINAWIWSSVFHTRDLPITEKLDYFSAALAILFALYFTVIRFFHIYPETQTLTHSPPPKPLLFKFWTLICVTIYLVHIAYLAIPPRFDYAYNMSFNLIIGLIHNALWLSYSLPANRSIFRRFPFRPRTYRPKYANTAAWFVVLTTAATALELFDFAPWGRVIDAHALWHLSTAPIANFWYDFLVQDALDEGWRVHKA